MPGIDRENAECGCRPRQAAERPPLAGIRASRPAPSGAQPDIGRNVVAHHGATGPGRGRGGRRALHRRPGDGRNDGWVFVEPVHRRRTIVLPFIPRRHAHPHGRVCRSFRMIRQTSRGNLPPRWTRQCGVAARDGALGTRLPLPGPPPAASCRKCRAASRNTSMGRKDCRA